MQYSGSEFQHLGPQNPHFGSYKVLFSDKKPIGCEQHGGYGQCHIDTELGTLLLATHWNANTTFKASLAHIETARGWRNDVTVLSRG